MPAEKRANTPPSRAQARHPVETAPKTWLEKLAADAPPQHNPPTSLLDFAQRNTQRSEIDGSNTSPYLFLVLVAIQPPIVAVLALWWGVPLTTALFPIAFHVVGSLLSWLVVGDAMFFDVWGEVAIAIDIAWSYTFMEAPTVRQQLCTAACFVWVVRLGGFLGWRIIVRGWDWRFAKLMDGFAYNLFCFVCQGTWIFLQLACITGVHSVDASSDRGALDIIDGLAIFVAVAGLAIEHVSDMQKSAFNTNTSSNKHSTWIQCGLWRYSRHPNYFGEMLTWVGMGIGCWGCLPSSLWPLCLLSPLWSMFFLVFTSLALLEKRLDKKFGGQPAYENYKRNTSCLLPWPHGWGWTGPKKQAYM